MPLLAARVKETTATTGTGTLSLDGPVAGFQSFVAGIGNSNKCYYTIIEVNNWEVGIGTVTDSAPDTLSRDTVLASSNGGAKLNLGAGSKDVFVDAPAESLSEGSWGSRGQDSKNNATTPNTKFDLAAASVTLRNAENRTVTIHNPNTITNDIGLDNTNANARDQAAAFSASSWIHFYWVWGPSVGLRSRSSVTAPPTGLTLQTGETHWSYATAARLNASTFLLSILVKGAWAYYSAENNVLTAGTATVETNISLSTFVPPNALKIDFHSEQFVTDATGDHFVQYRIVTGNGFFTSRVRAESARTGYSNTFQAPNNGQNIIYIWSSAATAREAYLAVIGFMNPNGGE